MLIILVEQAWILPEARGSGFDNFCQGIPAENVTVDFGEQIVWLSSLTFI